MFLKLNIWGLCYQKASFEREVFGIKLNRNSIDIVLGQCYYDSKGLSRIKCKWFLIQDLIKIFKFSNSSSFEILRISNNNKPKFKGIKFFSNLIFDKESVFYMI